MDIECLEHKHINPLRTVDGYTSSLRDATGPVDMYSRIPTSAQVVCIAASCTHAPGLIFNGGNGGNCLCCPWSLPWCPFKSPNRNVQIPHRGALYQGKIALPLQVLSIRPDVMVFKYVFKQWLILHNSACWHVHVHVAVQSPWLPKVPAHRP